MQLPQGSRIRVATLDELPVTKDRIASLEALLRTCDIVEVPAVIAPLARLEAAALASDGSGEWLRVSHRPPPPLVVLTELEAPEPMRRILSALAAMRPGDVFLALLPHRPAPLLPLLDAKGAQYDLAVRPDGQALLWLSPGSP